MTKALCNHLLLNPECNLSREGEAKLRDLCYRMSHGDISAFWDGREENSKILPDTAWCWVYTKISITGMGDWCFVLDVRI